MRQVIREAENKQKNAEFLNKRDKKDMQTYAKFCIS